LFRAPARLDPAIVPWATYTDPELAQVGLSEDEARKQHGEAIRVLRWKLAENDRAQAERETDGLVKVVTDSRGRVLGAAIVGPHAGDLIQPWCLALSKRLKIAAMASFVPPYPTFGEASKRAAGSYFTEALFGPRTRGLVRFLARLPVW
jgi:pyruvate/2-oxoglutarate dehydrogenase complex dihydrolipoamide dehydrogenase (E3) component